MKFTKTVYGGTKEILATKNFSGIGVMVDDEGVVANDRGAKIVKAGTIIGGKSKPTLTNHNEPVATKEGAEAEGVLLCDVDVTHGPNMGTMVIRGEVDLNKIVEPSTETIAALATRILFIK